MSLPVQSRTLCLIELLSNVIPLVSQRGDPKGSQPQGARRKPRMAAREGIEPSSLVDGGPAPKAGGYASVSYRAMYVLYRQRDSNSRYRLERAASWTGLDDGGKLPRPSLRR